MVPVLVVCALVGPLGAHLALTEVRLGKPVPVMADGQPIEWDGGLVLPFVGDFDGDGRQALLLGVWGERGRLLVYRNVGPAARPRLGPPTWFDDAVPTGWIPKGCKWVAFRARLADFDGDGRPDLLAGSHCCDPTRFHLFRRKADGSWEPRRELGMSAPNSFEASSPFGAFGYMQRSNVAAADWNGDGVPDLLMLAGDGGGILAAPGPFDEGKPIPLTGKVFTGGVRDFAVADWDGDCRPDLLTWTHSDDGRGGISWYKAVGPGLTKLAEGKRLVAEADLAGEKPTPASRVVVQGFCVGDLSGDGRPDLIVTRDDCHPEDAAGTRWSKWRGAVWLYPRE